MKRYLYFCKSATRAMETYVYANTAKMAYCQNVCWYMDKRAMIVDMDSKEVHFFDSVYDAHGNLLEVQEVEKW